MDPKFKQDLQNRLQQLEAEIHSKFVVDPQSKETTQSSQSGFSTFNSLFTQKILIWFNKLPRVGKLVVLGAAVLFSFAILQAFIKFIASAISLALLALLVYLGYKFLVSNSSQIHK